MSKIRLQVFLSRNGICSRREAMALVKSGQVRVNKRVETEPSYQVDPAKDQVFYKGKPVGSRGYDYVLLHKPSGYVTTKSDTFAKKKVMDLLPDHLRHLNPVGRLDKETEGLLLLTNDGDALYALTHPKFNVGKRYFVRVKGEMDMLAKASLESGVVLDEKKTSPAKVSRLRYRDKATDFEIVIHEGWNRQVRRMCEKVGFKVRYLKRIQHGPVRLGDLPRGKWRRLTKKEVAKIVVHGS